MEHHTPDSPIEIGATRHASINDLHAGTLSAEQSAIQSLQAETVVTHLSAIGSGRTSSLETQTSALGAVQTHQAEARTSVIGGMEAEQATLSRSCVHVLQAADGRVYDNTVVGLLLARQVQGSIRPIFDLRGVIVLGLVIGLVLRLAASNAKKTP